MIKYEKEYLKQTYQTYLENSKKPGQFRRVFEYEEWLEAMWERLAKHHNYGILKIEHAKLELDKIRSDKFQSFTLE